MENLISSTDYNIQQFELLFTDKISRDIFIEKVISYSKILKLPISKNMFVPCDEFNNILEEPKNYKDWIKKSLNTSYNLDSSKYEEYKKQKKLVLFKDWGFFKNSLSYVETGVRNEVVLNDNVIYFYEDSPAIFVSSDLMYKTPINTVEDLLKTEICIKLTENINRKYIHIKNNY